MFYSCTNLKTIYVGTGWNTDNVDTTGMFNKCGTQQTTNK